MTKQFELTSAQNLLGWFGFRFSIFDRLIMGVSPKQLYICLTETEAQRAALDLCWAILK